MNTMENNALATEVAQLRAIVDGSHMGSWMWNVQTGEVVFNERWAEMFGYTLEELQPVSYATWQKLCLPKDLAISEQALDDYFNGKANKYSTEARVQHKNGGIVWIRDTGLIATYTSEGKPEWMCGGHVDITEFKENRMALAESRERLQKIADNMQGTLYQFVKRPDGNVAFPYASSGIKLIYGVTPEQVKNDATVVFKAIHPDDLARVEQSIEQSYQTLEPWECEYRVIVENQVKWVYGHSTPEREADGTVLWNGLLIDQTERKLLEKRLAQTQSQLEAAQRVAHLGYWQADVNTGEMEWSETLFLILEQDPLRFKPTVHDFLGLVHASDRDKVRRGFEPGYPGHEFDFRVVLRNQEIRWLRQWGLIHQSKSDPHLIRGTLQDITERKELELMLLEQSTRDSLTGLYNRRYFMDFIEKRFSSNRAADQNIFSIISFDFDHFKRVNDNYGHLVGDEVLRVIGRIVFDTIRETEIAARVGGEEFMIYVPGASATEAATLAERLRQKAMKHEFLADQTKFTVTITCGVAERQVTERNFQELLGRADRALYKGKESGRNKVVIAEP
ncbi:diguanylate cyclase [Pseudidiomarina taiwanensis]|uniref:diguanylate cyclase n=1 Tax=Pseudidiomarina taiwanensis TaxID=337250 RepID=A0A432ZHJ3_9GAMM|nr:GGDEF domain-containing protein [Pseudidiomarina taiwanensis]RUO76752.1 hypothetical protein CWI83_07455 [Pseudidiomarina taiwanensis]